MPKTIQRDSSTGKLRRDSATGKLLHANADGGCCCGCADCGGSSPRQFTCTLADVALAQGCSNGGSALDWVNVDQTTLAGTFTLDRQDAGDPFGLLDGRCVWTFGQAPGVAVSAQAYRGSGCADTRTGDYGFFLRLSRQNGAFTLQAWLGNVELIFHHLFYAVTAAGGCAGPVSFTADNPASYHEPKGSGGSSAITPV